MKAETIKYVRDLYWGTGEFEQIGGVVDDLWTALWSGPQPLIDPATGELLSSILDNLENALKNRDVHQMVQYLHNVAVAAVAMQFQLVIVGLERANDGDSEAA